jgi:Mlc titration factor MtfA (ptsG expression regulator)
MFGFKRRRRDRLHSKPFPEQWRHIIDRNVPMYRRLSDEDQRELQGHVQVFVAEKYFEGCDGLVMTDEIRVTIAAQACVLLLHRQATYYPGLRSILVYPAAYVANSKSVGPGGIVTESIGVRAGESWHPTSQRGVIVLSWSDVLAGSRGERDGRNVVLHEFAHQLDGEYGGMDGVPHLPNPSMYKDWARVLGQEYQSLVQNLMRNHRTGIDPYGATNPAEFFAVVTEVFFERPRNLQAEHPQLYEQLKSFYQQDPAAVYT